ncbi:MAG: protein arginine kinase [Phycisphaerales bacterium]
MSDDFPIPPDDSASALERGAEWLRGEGECADVVFSSRVRLARNLAGMRFAIKASRADRQQSLDACREAVMRSGVASGADSRVMWADLHSMGALDRSLLVERHLISKPHSKGRGTSPTEDPRGVAISVPDERLSIMVNEEDHLRIQCVRSGLALSQAWADADRVDDQVESRLDYAFSERLGYLTACPTNVGTGLRMGVMLHLPGLRLTGEIEKVKRAADGMSLVVRGFYGEGSEAVGDLFQISNQTTLGRSEVEVLRMLEHDIIPKVVEYERVSRRELLAKRRIGLEDQVWRAWGELCNARLLTTDEAMRALSMVRLGVVTGLIRAREGSVGEKPGGGGLSAQVVNMLLLMVQPAHLQRVVGREVNQEQRRVARASLLRRRLGGLAQDR